MSDSAKPPTKLAGGKFEIDKKIGAGCFGEVWRGVSVESKEGVAVKFESNNGRGHALQLEHEYKILKLVATPTQPQGFATVYHWGQEGHHICMVMELLGRSLEDRLSSGNGNGKFPVPTTLLIAEQVLHRIEYLHSKCIIHRDIKPENFMFGVKGKIHHIYLIDFGLSKKYWDTKHVQIRSRLSLTGTARYASINAHKGMEQSRRDDLEAIGHMLIYFIRGSLPWSGLEAKTQEEKYRKIRETKESVPLSELCKGHPDAFKEYLRITRDLQFKDKPEYEKLRNLFKQARAEHGPKEDNHFPWLEGKDLGTPVKLTYPELVRQPDDDGAKKKSGACFPFCGGGNSVKD